MSAPRSALLALAALAAVVVPTPAPLVERLYSRGIYLAFQPYLTGASNRAPIALIDLLIVVVIGGWLVALVRDLGRMAGAGWLRIAGRAALRTVALVSALYLAFLGVWGLNYRRVPLAEQVQFDAGAVSPDGLRALAAIAVDRVNGLYDRAHALAPTPTDPRDTPLAAAYARAQRELGGRIPAVPGRPKQTIVDLYFRRAAVDGMTDPFFLETLVASKLLPFERPFVVAHEWAHLAGFADEGDANFVGWLTCLRGGERDQYSGWLFLFGEIASASSAADRSELARRLASGPAADRRAIADRFRRDVDPHVFSAGWQVYDRYLRANRVEAGTASYGQVLRLALGARFGPDWTPLLK